MAPTRWSRVTDAAAAVWLATAMFFSSDAGSSIIAMFLLIGGGGLLSVLIGVRLLFRRSGFVALGMLLAGVGAATWPAPSNPLFRLRFALSERALTARAVTALSTRAESTQPEWIGLFRVERLSVHDRQVRFITAFCGVVNSCGVVYSPSGSPQRWMEDQFTPLHGAWWHVFEGF